MVYPNQKKMDELPADYYEMNSCHLDFNETQLILDSFFLPNKMTDVKKVLDTIKIHPFSKSKIPFNDTDPLDIILRKVASFVLLRAYHYKKFKNTDVLELVGPFLNCLQLLWFSKENQNDRFIILWRAFYILNYSKALIDEKSVYLIEFSKLYSHFCKVSQKEIYELKEELPHQFQSQREKEHYNEVLEIKIKFFKFMESNLFKASVKKYCESYGKWPLDLNLLIYKLKEVKYYFTDKNIGVAGITGAYQILLSYHQIAKNREKKKKDAIIFILFVHETGHSLMRMIFESPMIVTPKMLPNNIKLVDQNLESGFAMEFFVFGQYKFAIWELEFVLEVIFDENSWEKQNCFFSEIQFLPHCINLCGRGGNYYGSGLSLHSKQK